MVDGGIAVVVDVVGGDVVVGVVVGLGCGDVDTTVRCGVDDTIPEAPDGGLQTEQVTGHSCLTSGSVGQAEARAEQ